MRPANQPPFLPVSLEEAGDLGIDRFDVILVSGDAYVDHPSFATAILGRVLWDAGYSVGVLAQPDWREQESFRVLGEPRLFFSISAGSMDSMVCNYTPGLKRRRTDVYSPGGEPEKRPDRTTLVYSDILHRLYPDVPIIIGGIEASLRRFAHYDYWSDSIRQSILADAPADLLVYGMGERQLLTISKGIDQGAGISSLTTIPGTVWKTAPKIWNQSIHPDIREIPSYQEVSESGEAFARAHAEIIREQDPFSGRPVLQRHPKKYIIQNPPSPPLSSHEMDQIYDLPFRRRSHPSYTKPVPALEPVRFSLISHRGCYGDCSFCALSLHQGKIIQSRSSDSILREIREMIRMNGFRGTISDIGGPSANMYGDRCARWENQGTCPDRDCLTCRSRSSGLEQYLRLLSDVSEINGVKHLFIGSGIRYDLLPPDPNILEEICRYISGHLKVAPEHISSVVTSLMNKPGRDSFDQFRQIFEGVQRGKKPRQYLVPYLMSGHPGCTTGDMIDLAEYLRDNALYTEQVRISLLRR